MDSLNKLTNNKLEKEIRLFEKTIGFLPIPMDLIDSTSDTISALCELIYWNGYYRGANDGYDIGYLDGRDPGDYKKGW